MPRHFPSKTDYRKYVKKCHEQARIFTGEIKGTSCSTARTNFHPKIDTEKDYFNDKYQNVVRGYPEFGSHGRVPRSVAGGVALVALSRGQVEFVQFLRQLPEDEDFE
jgi:hypothetical protein